MTEQSIYSYSLKSPAIAMYAAKPLPDFAPYACNIAKLEPRIAMQVELRLAAAWAASSRQEGHMARLPAAEPKYHPHKPATITPKQIETVFSVIGTFPQTAFWVKCHTPLSRACVLACLSALTRSGRIAMLPADPDRKRPARFILPTAKHIDEKKNTTEAFHDQLKIALSLLAEPQSITSLSQTMQIGKSSGSRIIHRLANEGLIHQVGKVVCAVWWQRTPHAS
jgi:hypothetical protein